MALEDLYREVILDHYRNPRNKAPIPDPDVTAEGVNPLCGDEVTVQAKFEDGRIAAISVHGQGCSISQSSASMMSEAVKGKTFEEITGLVARFRAMMDIEGSPDAAGIDPDRPGAALGDLEALQGVRKYPVRIKCANLPWATLAEALDEDD